MSRNTAPDGTAIAPLDRLSKPRLAALEQCGRRVDAYWRVSRIGGRAGDSYISPEQQREQIQAMATLLGVTVDQWHDDEDESGGNNQRPGWLEVVRRIEEGETGGVIVAKLDRFARDAVDGPRMVRRILQAGGLFASAIDRVDPTTEVGWAMTQMMFVMAELQLNQLKAGWRDAKRRAIERGAHIGPTPFGFDRVPRGVPDAGQLRPNGKLPIVRELFLEAPGRSDKSLAAWMDEHSPRGNGRYWTSSSVRHVLENRIYLGEIRYLRRNDGDATDLVNTNALEPIVSEAEWRAAQKPKGMQRKSSEKHLLGGIARCQACGSPMYSGPGGSSGRTRVYRCSAAAQGQRARGRCPAPSVVVSERLEAYVLEQLRLHYARARDVEFIAIDDASHELKGLEQALALAREELEAFFLVTSARAAQRNPEAYRKALAAREEAVEEAERKLERAVSQGRFNGVEGLDWSDLTPADLRQLVAAAVATVWLRRAKRGADIDPRVRIEWTGAEDDGSVAAQVGLHSDDGIAS